MSSAHRWIVRALLASFVVCSGVTMHGALASFEHRAATLRWALRPIDGDAPAVSDDGWASFRVRRVCEADRCELFDHLPGGGLAFRLSYPRDRYLRFDGARLGVLEAAPTPVPVPPPMLPRWTIVVVLALALLRALRVSHRRAGARERFFAQSCWVEVEVGGKVRLPDGALGRCATTTPPGSGTLVARRGGSHGGTPYRAEAEELVDVLPGHPTVHLVRAARERGRAAALAAAVVVSVVAQIVAVACS